MNKLLNVFTVATGVVLFAGAAGIETGILHPKLNQHGRLETISIADGMIGPLIPVTLTLIDPLANAVNNQPPLPVVPVVTVEELMAGMPKYGPLDLEFYRTGWEAKFCLAPFCYDWKQFQLDIGAETIAKMPKEGAL